MPYSNSNIYIKELHIIDTNLFNAVQTKIKSRVNSTRTGNIITAKSNTVLEGLCFSYCNRKMNIDYNRGVKILKSRCKCSNHQKTFNYEKIENTVLNQLFNKLNTIDWQLLEQKVREKKDVQYREAKLHTTKSPGFVLFTTTISPSSFSILLSSASISDIF